MFDVVSKWFKRVFAEEEAVYLFFFLAILTLVVIMLGRVLAPVLAALVIAYLLQGLVNYFSERGLPSLASVYLVFSVFLGFIGFVLVFVMPLLWNQLVNFINNQLPSLISSGESFLLGLQQKFPEIVSQEQVNEWTNLLTSEVAQMSQTVLSFSLASLPNVLEIMIFLVLVPILVFFLLKDKLLLIDWLLGYLPPKRNLMSVVWVEMDEQISNYVQGKALEILIVTVVTYLTFLALGLNYALLLAISVGLSVIIPYIGALIVTLPVALVAYIQFGFSSEFGQVVIAYMVIQALDGNVMVPLLFSEAVNLHPVAIIVAILFFGGFWGLWGVFFAIPLATLINAVLHAWPGKEIISQEATGPPEAGEETGEAVGEESGTLESEQEPV